MNGFVVFFFNLAKLILPILGAFLFGYALLLLVSILGVNFAFWCAIFGALALMIVGFYLYHTDREMNVAYGCAIAGSSLLYAAVYQAYVSFHLFEPIHAFWYLTIIACAAVYAAVRFQGWLLAVLAISMGLTTPSLVLHVITRFFLSWYFVVFLALSMVVAYWRRWFELALLSFFGYLLYNPLLFAVTDLEGKKGFLSIYQVFWIMGAVFCIYTFIPYFYSFFRARKRIFEAVSITIGGAYSFALIRHVIQQQLAKVEKLPFFIKFLAGKTPLMGDVHMNMFLLFGAIYASMFLLLFIINRKAKVVLGALASLTIICTIGAFYAQRTATGVFGYIMRFRRFLINTMRLLAK